MTKLLEAIAYVTVIALATGYLLADASPVRKWHAEWSIRQGQIRVLGAGWERLASDGMILTGDDSVADLVVFTDYQCPYCRAAEETIRPFLGQHPGVTVAYRNFPLSRIHDRASEAAYATTCAEAHGQFPALHSYLMSSADWYAEADWRTIFAEAGLQSIESMLGCLDHEETRARVAADSVWASILRLQGTPAFVTRDEVRTGTDDLEELLSALR